MFSEAQARKWRFSNSGSLFSSFSEFKPENWDLQAAKWRFSSSGNSFSCFSKLRPENDDFQALETHFQGLRSSSLKMTIFKLRKLICEASNSKKKIGDSSFCYTGCSDATNVPQTIVFARGLLILFWHFAQTFSFQMACPDNLLNLVFVRMESPGDRDIGFN